MQPSTKISLLLVLAVVLAMCATHPPSKPVTKRDPRSPQGSGSIKVLDDSRKGPVAKAELGGTLWESKDGNVKVKTGVDYTQPLGHGRGEGSAFIRVGGRFRK